MPKNPAIQKVLVIGSGPIIIGQAAEFDYAGTQACRALKEEGVEVVLVNSNPATIMTDNAMADKVYLEPLTVEFLKKIIAREKPDGLLATLGGQTGLNLASELAESGYLDQMGVRLLGTSVEAIRKAEDREAFKQTMEEIGQPVIDSIIATKVEEAVDFAKTAGYPMVVRPAYTLGGTGGGIAANEEELREITTGGLKASRVHQCLIEKCVSGWKEIEYEVVRDAKGNTITICNMENMDPVGIHTGDSIVVAPSQTLRDKEHQMLRTASLKIIDALRIEGGCNVQFALDTQSMSYYVIEVNPRLSRSSALASKATGYPIAKVASKIAIGYDLGEIQNGVTGKTYACFEPTLDYCVVKFPRWPFDKFVHADKRLGTKMKATGEVMSIGANFEAALFKAIRSLELGMDSLEYAPITWMTNEELLKKMSLQDHERAFAIAEALRRGIDASVISQLTFMDAWFLDKLKRMVDMEETLKKTGASLNEPLLRQAKKMGISDRALARYSNQKELDIRAMRKQYGILPTFKMVDTCGAEFEAVSPYYYSSYDDENEAKPAGDKTVVVLGSGPIRIGQGIEFDYCSVHCVWALKQAGYEAVIINNNPETVSTDFDTSDRLYFEPLTPEEVWNVLEQEKPVGVTVQFGGQTAIKLAKSVVEMGYEILGTSLDHINMAEDREEFDALLERSHILRPAGQSVFTEEEAVNAARELGYPVLVRPSYVLGGQGMEIAYDEGSIRDYMRIINREEQEHPILVDKYVIGTELEVDAICDGTDILIPGIMEHIERAGVHSGDSISVYPSQTIPAHIQKKIVDYTRTLAKGLHVLGMVNIQFIRSGDDLYIIEVNPRSSRTVPYISKVTGIPLIDLATKASIGQKISDMGYGKDLLEPRGIIAVKVPVFSLEKLPDVEVTLGPEMKSTGEVLGVSTDYSEALYKGLLASGMKIPEGGKALLTIADNDKQEAVRIAADLDALGFDIYATPGTAHVLNFSYVAATTIAKMGEGQNNILDRIDEFTLIINTPTRGRKNAHDGFALRRMAVERRIPCLTSLDTANALVQCIKRQRKGVDPAILSLTDILNIGKV